MYMDDVKESLFTNTRVNVYDKDGKDILGAQMLSTGLVHDGFVTVFVNGAIKMINANKVEEIEVYAVDENDYIA